VALALFALLWATWPWSSQITWLLPVEDELHSYMKKTQPLEADILGERAQLAAGDTAREHMDKILKDSEELLALNEEYWVQGKEQPWFRAFMYKIRGMEQPPAYLPSWPGPKDPEGKQMMVTDMPADTATLAAYAWQMKEASNALATERWRRKWRTCAPASRSSRTALAASSA